MKTFLVNILLSVVWAAAAGEFTLTNLFIGFFIGFFVLFLSQRVTGPSRYFYKARELLIFVLFFLRDLVMSNLRMARDVVSLNPRMRPGVITVPIEAQTDTEIAMVAMLISLTPGTLTLDVADNREVLYVHAMFIEDIDELRAEIKETFERRVLEVMR